MPHKSQMYTIIMFTMSRQSEWNSGIRNRNYFILQELLKRDDIARILAIEYLPITPKEKTKVFLERITRYHTFSMKALCKEQREKFSLCSLATTRDLIKNLSRMMNEKSAHSENEQLIVWSYFPLYIGYYNLFPKAIAVFDAVDDWSLHPAYRRHRQKIRQNYDKIEQTAKCIFTVSKDLRDRLFHKNPKVHWIPNGVDAEQFADLQSALISQSQANKKIRIGYIGTIQSRIDFDLMQKVVSLNPDKEFIFAGPIWKDAPVEKMSKFKNVIFTGRISYDNIYLYLADFSVAIIPHKQSAFTRSMNPMKMYEYLAAGLPVVSTCSIDGAEKFLYIADTASDFSLAIARAIGEDSDELKKERRLFACTNSWKSRADEMMEIITKLKT